MDTPTHLGNISAIQSPGFDRLHYSGMTSPYCAQDAGYFPSTPHLSPIMDSVPSMTPYTRPQMPQYPTTTSLQRLHSNPMFRDLQNLLTEECLHMQVPTNLVNTTWGDASCSPPAPASDMYSQHLRLQERLLQLRSSEKFRHNGLQIESKYSAAVGQIEVARYQALCAAGYNFTERQTVNGYYDNKRTALIQQCQKDITAALTKSTVSYSVQDDKNTIPTPTMKLNGTVPSMAYPHHQRRSHQPTPYMCQKESVTPTPALSPMQGQADLCDSGVYSDESALHVTNSSVDILQQASELSGISEDLFSSDLCSPVKNLVSSVDINQHEILFQQCATQTALNIVSPEVLRGDDSVTICGAPISSNSRKRKSVSEEDEADDEPKRQCTEVRYRGNSKQLTDQQTAILTTWYSQHVNYPYPSEEEINQLAESTELQPKQVKKWMSNKRVRSFNTLSISGNQHPIKLKFKGQKQTTSKPAYQQLTGKAKQILTDWYETHINNPYPTDDERAALATQANIPESKVKSWFANKRSRSQNTKRQVPNYFIKKFPEYTSHVQMVSISRELTRKTKRQLLDTTIDVSQMCRF